MIPFIITGCVIFSASVYLVRKSQKNIKSLEEYEQKNRAPDGTVNFSSIQQSRTHGANRHLLKVILMVGYFIGLFGLILIGYGLNLFQPL